MFFSGIADEAGKPLDKQISAHKELGWKHIEIRNVNATTLAYATDAEFNEIHAALQNAGMQVSCFASQIANWARDIQGPFEQDVDELRRAIPRMLKMRTPFIRVMSWANKNNTDENTWRAEAIRRMKELAKMAEDGGVALVHENCDGWAGLGPKQTLELLQEVGSPALKLVYDTGNPVHHKQDPWAYYSGIKQHIAYIHIKDSIPQGDKFLGRFAGEGNAEVPRVLADLLTWYDGGISIEPHIAAVVHEGKESDPELMYQTYVEYGRKLMEMVKELTGSK